MARFDDGKGHSVEVFTLSEHEEISMDVSTHPVEDGSPITDHSQMQSKTFRFSGWIHGNNQSEVDAKYNQLQDWARSADLVTYSGAIRHNGMLISNLTKDYDDGGFQNVVKFSLDLTAVFTVKVTWNKNVNAGKKQASPPAGVYVTVVAGNTYWGWWVQYGTSIDQLRAWNGWPDRFIPIGARARVK
ncbi:LysM peptidoglycan-binding domain-containing protein [Weissella confusa]|uniref:LysM peptidoglycan-binding domain-containing protein n=1 Tax=Weissella confusa TaxID=1583 RepID=UPI001C11F8A3|nr:LysM peptidoglycan-binding domain-containing protein [Weissella confusa]MBU5285063.1 LysM peptidoglycan-binding domain-containing protein [Weissella confusa]MEE0001183.1 LysM peptidoglycan-binding domain-containing protein [Weissella confusa]